MIMNYWYSERCTRQIKFIVCIVVCSIIFLSSKEFNLSSLHIIFALCLGSSYHFIYQLKQKLSLNHSYKTGMNILFFVLPLAALIALVISLPSIGRLYLMIQTAGFTLIGFFLVSIYAYRSKKSDIT